MVIFIAITTKYQGLTIEEKEELRSLRQQIKKYRELDTHHDDHHEEDNQSHSDESVYCKNLIIRVMSLRQK
jgi:hypothetical protein